MAALRLGILGTVVVLAVVSAAGCGGSREKLPLGPDAGDAGDGGGDAMTGDAGDTKPQPVDAGPDVQVPDVVVHVDGCEEAEALDAADGDVMPVPCLPEEGGCSDAATLWECLPDGTWKQTKCAEGTLCDRNACLPIICEPLSTGECVGSASYEQCNALGTAWEEGYCEALQTCYQGKCQEWCCLPDQTICLGLTKVQKCVVDEDSCGWEEVEDCSPGICKNGKCFSLCEIGAKGTLGCEFRAVDLDNVEAGQYAPVGLVVTAPDSAEISVLDMSKTPPKELSASDLAVPDLSVAAGGVKTLVLPGGFDIDYTVLTNKTFRLTSTAPVSVVQFNPIVVAEVYTNDASLLLPVPAAGTEHYVLSWPHRAEGYIFRGFVAVLATGPGTTTVQVWPTAPVLQAQNVPQMSPNPPEPYVVYLEDGDVLNLETDGAQGVDLTGTRIVADKPVLVFGGHECANVPLGVNYCNHLEEQIPPVTMWGAEVVGDAFRPRDPGGNQKDVWRVISATDGNQVVLDPPVAGPYMLDAGQWVEFATGHSFHLEATALVLVGHYMEGSNYPGFDVQCEAGTGLGDPGLTVVVPAERFSVQQAVYAPVGFKEDYLNITYQTGTDAGVKVDGKPLADWGVAVVAAPVGSSGWSVAQVLVPDGRHTVEATSPVGVTVYGYECDVSYAYPGAME